MPSQGSTMKLAKHRLGVAVALALGIGVFTLAHAEWHILIRPLEAGTFVS
jgi:hypothetical protein